MSTSTDRHRCVKCAPAPRGFVFESVEGQCPKCGGLDEPYIFPLIDIHLVAMDPAGPIMGYWGRQHVACEPKREVLSMYRQDGYAATDDPREVTCRSCKGTTIWKDLATLFAKFDKVWAKQWQREQHTGELR